MGWSGPIVCLVVTAGCGRIGFDPAGGAAGDGGPGGDSVSAAGCPSFAILCEDFESGTFAKWSGMDIVGPSTVAIDTTIAHGGTRSLDATKQPSASSGNADIAASIGTHATGTLAMRAWVNAPQPIINFDLVLGFGDAPNNNYVAVGGDDFQNWVASEARSSTQPVDDLSSRPTSVNTWECVELVFTFGTPPHIEVLIDNTQVLSVDALTPSPTFTYARVGAVRGDNLGFHVFVDDVVVATQRVGCN